MVQERRLNLLPMGLEPSAVRMRTLIVLVAVATLQPSQASQFSRVELEASEPAVPASHLNFTTERYLTPSGLPGDATFFPSLRAVWEPEAEGEKLRFKASLRGVLALSEPALYGLGAPELFIQSRASLLRGVRLSLGRKRETWSVNEDHWGLGLYQSRWLWDMLHPKPQGLVGLHADFRRPWFQAKAMVSPLFVPEQGGYFELKDGGFTPGNRWFVPPSSTLNVLGEETQITYNVEEPDLGEVVLHPSVVAATRFGAPKRGPWLQATYANKPVNQLLMGYSGFLDLTGEDPDVEVTVAPRVIRHQLGSLETGYNFDRVRVYGSATREIFDFGSQPAGVTEQRFSNAWIFGSGAQWDVRGRRLGATTLSVSYLRVQGGTAGDVGDQATPGTSLFDPRHPFQNALKLGLRTPVFPGLKKVGNKILASIAWTEDLAGLGGAITYARGSMLNVGLSYRASDQWNFGLSADILGVNAGSDVPGPQGLIGRYRTNDRVVGGMTYVF